MSKTHKVQVSLALAPPCEFGRLGNTVTRRSPPPTTTAHIQRPQTETGSEGVGGGALCVSGPPRGWQVTTVYFRSRTMLAGFSRYSLHRLEKRHMVAPSMMRWSADQLTFMMWARTTWPSAPNRGRTLTHRGVRLKHLDGPLIPPEC